MIDRRWVAASSPTLERHDNGSFPCQGVYHAAAGTQPRVAFIATHHNVDYADHYLAEPLARRGFGFLGWNTRYRGAEQHFLLEHALIDIGVGVKWLRETAGVETVVLLGNSGGGSLMGAYQAHATDGHVRGTYDMPTPDELADLVAADLFVSLNSHPGRPTVLTNWLDPSVTDEADPFTIDPTLDMYAHGPAYDAEFQQIYRAAQRARNQRITTWAKEELGRAAELGHSDRLFVVHRVWADLRFVDLSIDPSTRLPGCYRGDGRTANFGTGGIGRLCTLRNWLGMWSLDESQCVGEPHFARIRVPSLVVQSTGDRGVFLSDAQSIFDSLGAADRSLEWVDGEHYFETGGADQAAAVIADWTAERT